MPMSTRMNKLYKIAEKIDKQLTAYDFLYTVFVRHEDGSVFVWRDAVAIVYADETKDRLGSVALKDHPVYLMVFTEHHLFHVYDMEEIEVFYEYVSINNGSFKVGITSPTEIREALGRKLTETINLLQEKVENRSK